LSVESVDERDRGTQARDQELIAAERLLIDESTDVEYRVLSRGRANISIT
jgi:hypothetical protein